MLGANDLAGYTAACAAVRDADLRQTLGRIGSEVLVIAGTHDLATTAGQGGALVSAIAGTVRIATAREVDPIRHHLFGDRTVGLTGRRRFMAHHTGDFNTSATWPAICNELCARVAGLDIPVLCAGALVNPGDAVVADDDGVVIVPAADVARVAAVAQRREDLEGDKRAMLASGVLGLDMYEMRGPLAQAGLRYLD